jgi:hypothetical protein
VLRVREVRTVKAQLTNWGSSSGNKSVKSPPHDYRSTPKGVI